MSTRMDPTTRPDLPGSPIQVPPSHLVTGVAPDRASTRGGPALAAGGGDAIPARFRAFVRMIALFAALAVFGCSQTPTDLDDGDDPPPGEPAVASIEVSPAHLDLEVGETQQLEVIARDADGNELARELSDFDWSSNNVAAATVSNTGVVTAVSDGSATISAALGGQSASAHVIASAAGGDDDGDPGEEEPEEPAPDYGEWDFILEDTTVVGDVVVPEGKVWLIGADVQIDGNLRTTAGTIALRPGSSLRFLGADPEAYVGGGMTFTSEFANDIGLWIGPQGVLDIRGTPKQGWNRTGTHPTWEPDDEYWISPTDRGDYSPRRWHPGDPIPQIDPRAPAAEVINVTRDIVIQGPGHIHIHSSRPQWIEYVQLRNMGVSNSASQGPVLGRYALHLHMSGEGSRGTTIRGVAAVNSRGRVFVPHLSHGVTMIDNVSVNSYSAALWWDLGDNTHDLMVDGFAATGVHMPRSVAGTDVTSAVAGLGSGKNKTMRNTAVSGAVGNRYAAGFNWATEGSHREESSAVWTFEFGNVAHNNEGFGIRFWFNDAFSHHVQNAITYRNAQGGIENGAYANANRYSNVLLLDEGNVGDAAGHVPPVGTHHNSSPRHVGDDPSARAGYRNVTFESADGHALEIGKRNLPASEDAYLDVIDCVLVPGPGKHKVFIQDGNNPWQGHFVRSGVTPADIVFETLSGGNDGTHILIDHEDGRRWEIRVENGVRIDREL